MKIRAARSLFLLFVLAASVYGQSQDPPKNGKTGHPNLGLVLEGGGALGLAHIGVITWMEEHRIPVRYVAGTSMGGLVGGMYATGLSPAEVRQLINGIDWDQVLSGVTPFRDLSFRRKQDARDFPGQLEFGLRGGLRFPSGFNTGQGVNLVLDRSRFHIQRLQALMTFLFRLPACPPILSPANRMSSATALLHWPCDPPCRYRASSRQSDPENTSTPMVSCSTISR